VPLSPRGSVTTIGGGGAAANTRRRPTSRGRADAEPVEK
jgi:hypothetical protein